MTPVKAITVRGGRVSVGIRVAEGAWVLVGLGFGVRVLVGDNNSSTCVGLDVTVGVGLLCEVHPASSQYILLRINRSWNDFCTSRLTPNRKFAGLYHSGSRINNPLVL